MATLSITIGTQTVSKTISDAALARIIDSNRESYTLPAEIEANSLPNDNAIARRAGRGILNALLDGGNNFARNAAAESARRAVQYETGTDV